jgi:hypothetical protein
MWRFDNRVDTAGPGRMRELFLPHGVSTVSRKPSVAQYGNRLYMVGGHTENLVVDEFERVSRLGLMAPANAPTITGAVGTGNIGYLSFWDELTDEHSGLSGGTAISTATPRTWTDLPIFEPNNVGYDLQGCNLTFGVPYGTIIGQYNTPVTAARPGDKVYLNYGGLTCLAYLHEPDPAGTSAFGAKIYATGTQSPCYGKPVQRASHVCLWLSVAGGLPRLVTKVRLGTTAVQESVTGASLGETHPGGFERFPYCTMAAIYRDRLVLSGHKGAMDTVFLSAIGFPERWEGFKFKTRNGEAVTALISTRDYCLVMTDNSTYLLQGFTEDDMEITLVDNGVGATGQHTNAVVHGTPYTVNRQGMYMYNGAWHPVLKGGDKTFSRHHSKNTSVYLNAHLLHNPIDKTLQVFLPGLNIDTFVYSPGNDKPDSVLYEAYSWVVNYEPVQSEAGGGFASAILSTDRFFLLPTDNNDNTFSCPVLTAAAFLPVADGGSGSYVYHGDSLGGLYREDRDEVFMGESIVMTPTFLFDSAGGFEGEGKTLTKFWTHASIDYSGMWACAFGGDEWTGLQALFTDAAGTYGVDHPSQINFRLWGVVANRPWNIGSPGPAFITTQNGFGQLFYAHSIPATLLTGADVPTWTIIPADPNDPIGNPGNPGGTSTNWIATPKSVHEHPLPDSVSGRGIGFFYIFNNPINVTWRGVGGNFVPGPITRPTFFVPTFPTTGV